MAKKGNKMIESLTTIFNRVEEESRIPLQWRETSMKSLYKEGGSKEKTLKSQRGIFITNIVSKAQQHVQYADCRKEKQINNG